MTNMSVNQGFMGLKSHIPVHFETFATAKKRRAEARSTLLNGRKEARHVAGVLHGCRKKLRCQSESCSVCLRQFRSDLLMATSPILHSRPNWTAASIITAACSIQYGKLNQIDVPKLVATIRRRLQRSPVLKNRMVLGGVDICLNVYQNVVQHWQVHLYLLIEGNNDKKLMEAVKKAFPPEPTAARPYQFRPVTDFPEALSYAYKSVFNRRSSYNKDGNSRTRKQPLKRADLQELQTCLHRIPLGGRLVLHGIRRNGKPLRLQSTSHKKTSL